ncbi:hypothetical protein ACIPPQ_08350 [Sphingopyxis sp. LARHCG72]
MTLEEMIELGDLFQRLAGTDGATFSETETICRADQVAGLSEGNLTRIAQLASTLSGSDLGSLEVYADISGKVDLGAEPVSAIEGETVSVRLTKKSGPDDAYFLTHAGFEAALGRDPFILGVRKIWVADEFLPFATQKCVYAPWGAMADPIGPADIFDSPRRLVRDQSHHLAPSDVGPWYLTVPGDDGSAVFATWKEQAAKQLAFCLPTEIRSANDGFQVVLKGARSAFADVNATQSVAPMFDALTDAVRWIYDQRRDTETKFHLLNNHLALYWRDGDVWPLGLAEVLQNSLASAREAFAFHLQEDSKEAIKSLGDLRKALQDEVSRTQTATRDLLTALWRDAAIAGAAFALRTATANATMVNLIALSAAALLFASLVTTVLSNWRFDVLARGVREQWRKRLYAFMSAAQWNELVVQPISKARWVYRLSVVPVAAVYVALILALLWVPYPVRIEALVEFLGE